MLSHSYVTGPSAFRLKAHPGAVYEPALERGRPVLHGPLAANQLITEVGVFLTTSIYFVLTRKILFQPLFILTSVLVQSKSHLGFWLSVPIRLY